MSARSKRTATRTPSPSSASSQEDSFVDTLIDDTLIDEILPSVIPIPEIIQSRSWMSFVFKSAVSNKIIKFVTELQPICDACDINSFWAQSHYNNSDPNQNFVKLHEDVVTHDNEVWSAVTGTPTALISLAEAKSLMLTLVPGVISSEPEIPVTPAQMPNNSWVSISPGVFNLENNRVTGEILFIAQSNFGSNFYNQIINSITQIKSLDGNVLTSPKFNNLNFTETERDEKIQINEGAGGQTSVIVELFAWTQQGLPVAISKSFTVNLEDPAQVPAVAGAPGKMFNQIIAGLFMGGVALAFMGGLKGGKKKK